MFYELFNGLGDTHIRADMLVARLGCSCLDHKPQLQPQLLRLVAEQYTVVGPVAVAGLVATVGLAAIVACIADQTCKLHNIVAVLVAVVAAAAAAVVAVVVAGVFFFASATVVVSVY